MGAASWRTMWALIFALVVTLEGVALGRPELGDTLSETVRLFRFDPVGRYVLIPLWVWLTWHWILRPASMAVEFTWRDVVAIAVGIALAIFDARGR